MTPRWAISSWSRTGWRAPIGRPYATRSRWPIPPPPMRPPTVNDFLDLGAGLSVYDNEQWRSAATSGITRFLEPFTIAGYVVMAAAGLSVLNVFVLGLVQRKRERAVLRAIGVIPRARTGRHHRPRRPAWLAGRRSRCARGRGSDVSVVAGLTGVLRHQDRLGCAGAATTNRSGRRVRARPGCGGVSRDPCATVGNGRGAARQLTRAWRRQRRGDHSVAIAAVTSAADVRAAPG